MPRLKDELINSTLDQLKEVANIGAGNAITALSTLLNTKINMSVVDVQVKEITEVYELYETAEHFIIANLIEVTGGMRAVLLLTFEEDSAKECIFRVIGQ